MDFAPLRRWHHRRPRRNRPSLLVQVGLLGLVGLLDVGGLLGLVELLELLGLLGLLGQQGLVGLVSCLRPEWLHHLLRLVSMVWLVCGIWVEL